MMCDKTLDNQVRSLIRNAKKNVGMERLLQSMVRIVDELNAPEPEEYLTELADDLRATLGNYAARNLAEEVEVE